MNNGVRINGGVSINLEVRRSLVKKRKVEEY